MFNSQKVLVFFAICCFVKMIPAAAQPKCNFEHYSTADGLSDNRIMYLLKDREGFMWMGSWTGINRFDGHNFVTYKSRPGDRSELKNNRIDLIAEDHAGFLWLKAYDQQVYRFDKKTEQFLSFTELMDRGGKASVGISKIILLEKDQVALTTENQGLFLISHASSSKPSCKWFSKNVEGQFNLASDSINCVYQDDASTLWIGTRRGLTCIQVDSDGNYKKIAVAGPLLNINITSITENSARLWFGTGAGSVIGIDKTSGRSVSLKISGSKINHLKVSRSKHNLYISTASGELATVSLEDLSISTSHFPGNQLLSIYEDHGGLLWIEPKSRGVILFDPAKKTFRSFTQPSYSNYLHDDDEYAVLEDNKGIVWIKMKGCGFGYFDTESGTVKHFYNDLGKPNRRFSNMVSAEFMDPAGILWLSTEEGGLDKIVFQPNDFKLTTLVSNTFIKTDNDVRGIYSDSKGRLWVATKGKKMYVSYDGKEIPIDRLFPNTSFPSAGVYVMLEDRKGNIWMGTKGDGLFKAVPVNDERNQYVIKQFVADANNPESISHNSVYSLLEDRNGRIWVGTFGGGLNLVDDAGSGVKFCHYKNRLSTYPSNGFNRVRHLATDANGKLWIGTTDGLLLFDPGGKDFLSGSFVKYGKIPGDKESLGDNDVQFIYRDSRNIMWLLTSSGGLNKAIGKDAMRSLRFVNYTKKDGLPSDYLLSCIEDSMGYLWIATQNGLSRLNLSDGRFRNFDAADGLPQLVFGEASCAATRNGELVFGTMKGYIHFKPEEILNPTIKANIAFTNLQINSEDIFPGENNSPLQFAVNSSDKITLAHNQNIVSIDYAVLDYRSEEKESYAYRLLGFDSSWHDNKSARRVSYTNLPPGEYLFQVKSTSVDLYSNTPIKSITITILPPPWKTWWAYLLYVLFALLIILAVTRSALTMLRLRQRIIIERRLADLRLNFFTNISHELRTPLTLILNPLEEISKKESLSAHGSRHLDLALKNVRRMTRFINQLLDLRKAESTKSTLKVSNVELVSFTRRVAGYFAELASRKKINLVINPAEEEMYCWIDAGKIDIVLYNVLANAFKFSPDGKDILIGIRFSGPDKNILIEIIDQGAGVPLHELNNIFSLYFEGNHKGTDNVKGTGIGLALSREIVQHHHGNISARNNAIQGLTVSIELKAGKMHFEKDNVVFTDTADVFEEIPSSDMVMEDETVTVVDVAEKSSVLALPQLLLVEDNRDLRSFLKIQLSGLFEVATAENGEEGLTLARTLLPDLILSDVMMPVMNGITMLDKLKKDAATSHIPIVLLSSKSSVESQVEGLRYGADYYIAKPFNNEFLLVALNNLVTQRRKLFESFLKGKKDFDVQPPSIVITSQDELFLQQVIKIVEEKMGDTQFNIDVVADSVHMSRSAFYKKLKSLTSFSPVEFVREIRLKRSIQYLEAGEHNISVIAYEVGFTSAKYFSTCFKQRFGKTPSEYLKSNIKNTI